ncbi:carbohydrate-binding protein [Halalkalibacter kiskunsagensis]|uniref:Carbohydrate-binding protein n=1 Tax=Halalkalibacter kiskunsagensis TaxID=1548599 RepID=A0ABV6K6T3_9BACI
MLNKISITFYKLLLIGVCFSMVLVYSIDPVLARDSKHTRHGSGPMYWMAYENPYENNVAIPEDRWKNNIDWIAEEFLPYGYDMVSLDGWIEGSTETTSNGYVLKHNDNWQYTWKEWGDYIKEKGLEYGIYYNPLWVTPAAVNDDSKTVIDNPDLKVSDIVNTDITTTDWNGDTLPGDRFVTDQGENSLYWVDVTKPGAEDFVKGYVQYFKDAGASFLRIDFLSWYQTGFDGGLNKEVGHAHWDEYETALRWIHEAAGEDLVVSLVMPYLQNHGEVELKYGDMIRIDEDVFHGGWDHISGRSQTWQDAWSQWKNPFQGLTGFSDIGGRGQMILDADFIRMNKYGSEAINDNERRTTISLFTLGGSPIAIADQYDTINDTGSNNERFYQNSEVIELNKLGLVAKPLYKNANPFYPGEGYEEGTSRDTERWVGQLPNGEWVVGLFNRSDEKVTKSIDFISELGLTGEAAVRDLWAHKDLGYMDHYSADIEPHDVKLLKVIPRNSNKYEAEVASWIGTNFNNNHNGYSGFGFVDKFEASSGTNDVEPKVVFAVEAPESGSYWFNFKYANGTGGESTTTVHVKDGHNKTITDNTTVTLPATEDWSSWGNKNVELTLTKGLNLITIERTPSDKGAFNLDYIEFTPHWGNVVKNGGFETGNISDWTEWRPKGQTKAYGVDSNDVNSGKYKLFFHSPSAYKQSVHQSITGLDDGTYYVSAKVKRQGTEPVTARMEVAEYGESDVYVNIPKSSEYQEVSTKVHVTNGKIDVGFYVDSPGGTSLQVDDVKVTRVSLQNSNFEDEFRGWTVSDMALANIKQEDNNAYADITSSSKFTSDLFRYESLQEGTYTLKAKIRRSGSFDTAGLYIDKGGQTYKNTLFPDNSNWTEVTIDNINLSRDEVVKIGVYAEGNPNAWLHVDKVWLEKN